MRSAKKPCLISKFEHNYSRVNSNAGRAILYPTSNTPLLEGCVKLFLYKVIGGKNRIGKNCTLFWKKPPASVLQTSFAGIIFNSWGFLNFVEEKILLHLYVSLIEVQPFLNRIEVSHLNMYKWSFQIHML